MKAMLLKKNATIKERPLRLENLPVPIPQHKQILLKVLSCGICHTELDEIEGRLTPTKFPIILGHEIVGRVQGLGKGAKRFKEGDRAGIDWLNWACGKCSFCIKGKENLCNAAKWTGKDVDGGYAEYAIIHEDAPLCHFFETGQAAQRG